jgi:uncharacterized repeat protein (TIGR04138 family)
MEKTFEQAVAEIRAKDSRFAAPAYDFVRAGLDATVKKLGRIHAAEKRSRHISGQELCLGLRDHALERYGVMAHTLLTRWGLHRTDDFGAIVFQLVDAGVLGKTEDDSPEDFAGQFRFAESFKEPFEPGIRLRKASGTPAH